MDEQSAVRVRCHIPSYSLALLFDSKWPQVVRIGFAVRIRIRVRIGAPRDS